MRGRASAAALAAVMVLATGCTADEPDPEVSPGRAIVTSGAESEHLLVHGIVTRDGAPVPAATLTLRLWPDDPAETAVGEVVEIFDAAEAETDRDGRYALELDPDELTSQYFNGEFLNFDLSIDVDQGWSEWSSTVVLVDQEFWRSDEGALVEHEAMDISFDLDGPTILLTDSLGETTSDDFALFSG